MYKVELSVRELVEFVYNSGDLSSIILNSERAQLGSRIHRQIQKSKGANYQSEVFLKHEQTIDDITFVIEGRADGIETLENQVIVDEIKTTYIPYEKIDDSHFVHFAQCYCYAYFYMLDHNLEQIIIQVTYYQLEVHKTKHFQQTKSKEELEQFYLSTLNQYLKWAKLKKERKIQNTITIKQLQFPFPTYRTSQRELAVSVYRAIVDQKILYAQAPTGIGKTISTLFPALKALGEQKIEKIFYLCAKNITASVASDTMQLFYQQNVTCSCIHIHAKDKICLLKERNCDPNVCPYANNYYGKINDALYDLLQTHQHIQKEQLLTYAKEYEVCPFELSLDASMFCDVIICDYNYAFDPRVSLKRYFTEKNNVALLIDEAHNMVDRARSMYSAILKQSSFQIAYKQLNPKEKTLRKAIKTILNLFQDKAYEPFLLLEGPYLQMEDALAQFIDHFNAYREKQEEEIPESLTNAYFEAFNYMRIAEFYNEHYVTYIKGSSNDIELNQACLNPSSSLMKIMKKVRSAIYFSATLSPISYYTTLLGQQEDTMKLQFASPFDPKKQLFILQNHISTRYVHREQSIAQLTRLFAHAIQYKTGNYIAFFPSYQYMKQVFESFQFQYPQIKATMQSPLMSEQEKQEFLDYFKTQEQTHLLFCVLGGMFSEGIDLKGEQLIGTFIVGVGLPQINEEQDLIKDYFNEQKEQGYHYAYTFPGMSKVLQAAGRVIRTNEDYGFVICIDDRFATPFYRQLFPMHMQHYHISNSISKSEELIQQFWKTINKS